MQLAGTGVEIDADNGRVEWLQTLREVAKPIVPASTSPLPAVARSAVRDM